VWREKLGRPTLIIVGGVSVCPNLISPNICSFVPEKKSSLHQSVSAGTILKATAISEIA